MKGKYMEIGSYEAAMEEWVNISLFFRFYPALLTGIRALEFLK